ncbi:MAG: hypothetical protein CMG13_06620 [Candidatus Marinimicrobia bacterium]|nr:hypothetical protein [Candidatus Neomarinimicrobiota bacterium]
MKKTILIIIISSITYLQEASNGLILFTPYIFTEETIKTYLVDEDLNEINSWQHDSQIKPASMSYLLQDSTILYPYQVQSPTMESGGVGGAIKHLDWNNNLLWEYTISDYDYQHHHDIEPLPNGNILVLVWERKTLQEALEMGRETIESPMQQIWSEAIFEIEPIGADSANIVWEWHLWDHLIQDIEPEFSNYGNISEHPELLDINLGEIGFGLSSTGSVNADWIHFNSIHYNHNLDQIILSSRLLSEIYIIDHSTTTEEAATHSGGNSGKGGDFLYRWGNPQNYNRGDDNDRILNSQHSVNWIKEDYPGSGNIIIFNNHHYGENSSVIEISPPINLDNSTYYIEDDSPYEPEIWEWMFYRGDYLSSRIQSGAFRLENGNTFITDCIHSRIIEVNFEGDILFEHDLNGRVNRVKKYPQNYLEPLFLGDMNYDETINVLDIIFLVNIIVNEQDFLINADINYDQEINILDIITLINTILAN